MKKFTKQELREQLGMTEENVELIMKAQRIFPEILASEENGFCIEARKLHNNLVENVKTDSNGDKIKSTEFAKWIKRRIQKYKFIKNEDYTTIVKFDDAKFTQDEVNEMSDNKRSANGITNEYNLTLEMAKQLCMIENNELGLMCRKYFIKLEEAIKGKIEWLQVREPEKQGYNNMVGYVNKWCEINGFDNSDDSLSKREANLLNIALTGMSASDIKYYLGYKDINTREHLETQQNKALAELQLVNSSLLMANLDFKTRKQIIEDTCKAKYADLKIIS